jgi:hypothetical protein
LEPQINTRLTQINLGLSQKISKNNLDGINRITTDYKFRVKDEKAKHWNHKINTDLIIGVTPLQAGDSAKGGRLSVNAKA